MELPHPEILAHQETDEATITMKLKIPTFECQNVNGNPGPFIFCGWLSFSHSDKNIYWNLMMFEGGLPWVFNLSHDFAVAKSVKEKNLRKTEKHLSKIIQRESWLFFWWLSACLCCCGLSLPLKHQTQLKLGGPSRCPCWPQDCSCRVLVEGGVERGTTGHHRHPQIPDGSDFPPTQCWNVQISPPPCKGGKSVLGTVLKHPLIASRFWEHHETSVCGRRH